MKPDRRYLNLFKAWADWPENAVIVDLGAWKGITTRFFAENAPKGKVYAIEPCSQVIGMAKEYCIGKENVIFHHAAITDRVGETNINIYKKSESNSLFDKSQSGYYFQRKEEVNTISWDDFVDLYKIEKVDFCKVNIEGSENLFMQGMTRVFPKKMVIEEHTKNHITDLEELKQLIRSKGYRIVRHAKSDIWCVLL